MGAAQVRAPTSDFRELKNGDKNQQPGPNIRSWRPWRLVCVCNVNLLSLSITLFYNNKTIKILIWGCSTVWSRYHLDKALALEVIDPLGGRYRDSGLVTKSYSTYL